MKEQIILGSAQFGSSYGVSNNHGRVQLDEAREILGFARKVGIRLVDTASSYGESENTLGLCDSLDFEIITKLRKFTASEIPVRSWVFDELKGSLSRLNRRTVYALLLHSPLDLLGSDGMDLFDALTSLKMEGLVRKIGISIYSPAELDAIIPMFVPDIIQAPLNIIDDSIVSTGWLRKLTDLGVEVHIRSIFLQGLLLQDHMSRDKFFQKWSNKLQQVDEWIRSQGQTPLAACLGHVLSFEDISGVVIGVTSLQELEQIVESMPTTPIRAPERLRSTDPDLIHPKNWNKT